MNPGIMVSDVCHFKKVFVQPGLDQRLLKKTFMGLWRASGHHDTIEPSFPNFPGQAFLGIL